MIDEKDKKLNEPSDGSINIEDSVDSSADVPHETEDRVAERVRKIRDSLTPSYNVKDKYKEIRDNNGIKPMKRWVKRVVLTLIIATITFTLISTFNTKAKSKLEDSRSTYFDIYEYTKFAVYSDVYKYLTIQTKEQYTEAKRTVNFINWYKDSVFGSTFNESNFYGADNVTAVDMQYSFEDDTGVTKYYMLLNVTRGDVTKQISILVFVHNSEIFDIIVL